MDAIKQLEDWFQSQCDEDWEHQNGIKIETTDNPGWSIEISLADTQLDSKNFSEIDIERNERDWIHCEVLNKYFVGHGGTRNLAEIIGIFTAWAIEST